MLILFLHLHDFVSSYKCIFEFNPLFKTTYLWNEECFPLLKALGLLETRRCYTLFYKQCFFSTQPLCCLTFSWTELQMLLSCCLIYVSIIIVRQFLNLLYLCLWLDLGLFISYLCDVFFIFVFIFINIYCIISWIQSYLLFCLFFRICPIIYRWRIWIISVSGCCLAFALLFTNFSLVLLVKVLPIKKAHTSTFYMPAGIKVWKKSQPGSLGWCFFLGMEWLHSLQHWYQ